MLNFAKSITSLITTSVAFIPALFVTLIVYVIKSNSLYLLESAILVTVRFTGITSTVSFALSIVSFSWDLMSTTFVQLPMTADFATIHSSMISEVFKVSTFQTTTSLPFTTAYFPSPSFALPEDTYVNPLGRTSVIVTSVALIRAILFTAIVKLTSVLLPTFVILAVLLIVAFIGTTSTVALALRVVFWSHETFTTLLYNPIATDFATIQ